MLKFLKSFPFLSAASVQAALAFVVALGFHLSAVQTGSIEAGAAALLATLSVPHIRPWPVAPFVGLVTALGGLLVAFRAPHVTSSEVSAFVLFLSSLLGVAGHTAVQNRLLSAQRAAAKADQQRL